jgi:hypothetical protein
MRWVAIVTCVVLGALTAWIWQRLTTGSDTKPLFAALTKTVRAMVSEEGGFLQEYGVLLIVVGRFLLFQMLALVGSLAPALVALWLSWPYFLEHQPLLIIAYSAASAGGIVWLKGRAIKSESEGQPGGLSISDSQYFLLQVAQNVPWLIQTGTAIESRLLRRKLESVYIDRPIFVTGLARSGTTMLLELVAQGHRVATHRYRDFPFLMTPYLWNAFVNCLGARGDATARPHQDGIQITPESPEAFEEPIWQLYFPNAHRLSCSHVLGADDRNETFDDVFAEHIRKMLLIRKGARYLSKGNYNLTRIEYLWSLFPEAKFVVPIRHPLSHTASLVRQHELFCKYSAEDERVPHYLATAGHFEFGPQRVPISVKGSADRTIAAWDAEQEQVGYAIQWAAVYGYVLDLVDQFPRLAEQVLFVRYEDICDHPDRQLSRVLQHVGLEDEGSALLEKYTPIKPASPLRTNEDSTADTVWETTQHVATAFGYSRTGWQSDWRWEKP